MGDANKNRAWSRVAVRAVGGLTEIGFSTDEQFLLVVSWQGRGLIDTRSGEKVARSSEEPRAASPWRSEKGHVVLGIGPLDGVPIPCVGLWGAASS